MKQMRQKRPSLMEDILEEIIKRIIEIDNKAKELTEEEKSKKQNIEDVLQSEFNTGKAILDVDYKEEMQKKSEYFEELFEDKKKEIDENISNKKLELDNYYRYNEKSIIEKIINKVKES